MRSVDRGDVPATLKRNAKRWTEALLAAHESSDQKAIRKAENKYRKREIQTALKDMYDDLCCYCESNVSANSFAHIEHRKPKSKFPKDAFNWDNLHWVCEKCNNTKSNKWNCTNPILDPTVDMKIIPKHIRIASGLETIEFSPETGSGKTTIEHADLNRADLAKARHRIWKGALALKQDLMASEESPKTTRIRGQISEMIAGPYGSCIKIIFC